MMSMKLPSNEEMKKWNVDQVQEFLAQVNICGSFALSTSFI